MAGLWMISNEKDGTIIFRKIDEQHEIKSIRVFSLDDERAGIAADAVRAGSPEGVKIAMFVTHKKEIAKTSQFFYEWFRLDRFCLSLVIVFLTLLITGCTSPESPELEGGILVTFDVQGQEYSIFIANKQTIDDVYALQAGTSNANIPSGKLLRGQVNYNKPWSWHIDSEDIVMAEITIELCSGLPSYVEENLDYWVDTVGRFCPWTAELVEIEDYR
jgi:hypothetical protein